MTTVEKVQKAHKGITRRKKKREEIKEEIFEVIMAGNFPKLIIDTKPQIQEAWKTPSKINTLKSTPMYIIFKLQKKTEKISKENRNEDKSKEKTKPPYLQRNKYKNYVRLLSKTILSRKWREIYALQEKSNNLEFCIQ